MTEKQLEYWLCNLKAVGMEFHLDDNPRDIVWMDGDSINIHEVYRN